jgi:hypothetical protein
MSLFKAIWCILRGHPHSRHCWIGVHGTPLAECLHCGCIFVDRKQETRT